MDRGMRGKTWKMDGMGGERKRNGVSIIIIIIKRPLECVASMVIRFHLVISSSPV